MAISTPVASSCPLPAFALGCGSPVLLDIVPLTNPNVSRGILREGVIDTLANLRHLFGVVGYDQIQYFIETH